LKLPEFIKSISKCVNCVSGDNIVRQIILEGYNSPIKVIFFDIIVTMLECYF